MHVPHIVMIGTSPELCSLFTEVADARGVEVQTHVSGLDEAVPFAMDLIDRGLADVLVASRGTAEMLRKKASVPVLPIPLGSLNLAKVLFELAPVAKSVFFAQYVNEDVDLSFFERQTGVKVHCARYEDMASLEEAVRRYVREGGTYFGTCAGISAAINTTNRLQMAPYRFITNYYERGTGTLQVGFNEKWRKELALADAAWKLHYHGGPIIIPGDPMPDGEGETMAVCLNAIEGREKRTPAERDAMIGTPAFIYAAYGKGEVIACNTHPEARPETRELISAVFGRLTGRRIAIPNVKDVPEGYTYKADGTKARRRYAVTSGAAASISAPARAFRSS